MHKDFFNSAIFLQCPRDECPSGEIPEQDKKEEEDTFQRRKWMGTSKIVITKYIEQSCACQMKQSFHPNEIRRCDETTRARIHNVFEHTLND